MHAGGRRDQRGDEHLPSVRFEVATSAWGRLRGLFPRRREDAVLLLVPCRDVHTFGMQWPIDLAFASSDGKVLRAMRAVPPRKRVRCRGACMAIERKACALPWFGPGDSVLAPPGAAQCRAGGLMEGEAR